MRKITATVVVLGFLTSVSLPTFAAPAASSIGKSDELSAAKKKKKSDLGSTDLSAKKKKKSKKMDKKTEIP